MTKQYCSTVLETRGLFTTRLAMKAGERAYECAVRQPRPSKCASVVESHQKVVW